MMLNKHSVEVLGIVFDDVEIDFVVLGENFKIRLKGIEEEEIFSGFIFCEFSNFCYFGRIFDV